MKKNYEEKKILTNGLLTSSQPSLIVVGAGLGAMGAAGSVVDGIVVIGVAATVGFVVVAVVVDVVLK